MTAATREPHALPDERYRHAVIVAARPEDVARGASRLLRQ